MTWLQRKPVRLLAQVALCYLVVAISGHVIVDVLSWRLEGHSTGATIVSTVTWPLAATQTFPDPVAAFAPYDAYLRVPVYVLGFLSVLLLAWFALARHDVLNPVIMFRDPQSLPVDRRLPMRLRDVGIWREYDATRGDPRALLLDKLKYQASKLVPWMDPSRLAYRSNGMLVPFSGPQPQARIYLGTVRHAVWLRKRKFNVYARPEHHAIVFGPSGAGKGASQMNPSLLFWNGDDTQSPDGFGKGWPGPLITSTVKNDHVDVSLEWRLSLSSQCFIYDPMQLFPEYRKFWVGWDPTAQIRNFSDANRVASALMESESAQSAGGGNSNEEYFRAQALMVLAPMLLSAALSKKSFRTVYEWSLALDSEAGNPAVVGADGEVNRSSQMYAALEPLYGYKDRTGDQTPLDQLNQVFAKAEQEASGVWGSVRKSLQPYNDERSVMSTSGSTMPRMFDPVEFFTTPNATLYVIAPQVATESKRMRPVFAAFLTWLIEQAQEVAGSQGGKLPYPVLANLDEVKNVGALPGLAHTLSLTRSIGFFVKHAWQDEAQIESAYGKDDAKTVTSNSRTWVVLPGMSDSTHLEHLATLLGERKVRSRRRKGAKESSERVKAGSAAMIKELRDQQILILTDNLPPLVIDANRYYKDKVMKARFALGDYRRDTGIMPEHHDLRPLEGHRRPEVLGRSISPTPSWTPPQPPGTTADLTPPVPPVRPAALKGTQDQASPGEGSDYFAQMQAKLQAHRSPQRPSTPVEGQDPAGH